MTEEEWKEIVKMFEKIADEELEAEVEKYKDKEIPEELRKKIMDHVRKRLEREKVLNNFPQEIQEWIGEYYYLTMIKEKFLRGEIEHKKFILTVSQFIIQDTSYRLSVVSNWLEDDEL